VSAPTLVIGEGIAGQAAALALAERGIQVLVLAERPAEHSESVSRHDGLDAALGDDDSPERHLEDLLAAAGEAARPVLAPLTEAAPALVDALCRLDVPFERARNGELCLVKLPGSSRARSVHASCETARHVSRRLAARLLRHEVEGRLERRIGWRVIDLVRDGEGRVCGAVAQCFATGEIRGFAATGTCLATGGHAGLFMADTHAPAGLGAMTGIAVRHGAELVAPGSVSHHPFCYRAGGFVRRLPRRIAALGAEPEAGLLDLSKLDRAPLRAAAGSALEAYARATGADPYAEPIAVETMPDRTLGGLEITPEHATSVAGLFAIGGVVAGYAGSPLTAALSTAKPLSEAMQRYAEEHGAPEERALDAVVKRVERRTEELLGREGDESVLEIARELRRQPSRDELDALVARFEEAGLGDGSPRANGALSLAWELEGAFVLARRIAEAP